MTAFDRRPLAALCAGWFMVTIDATIVTVALPTIGRDLSASVAGLQWVVDAYTVVFAGLLLSGGFLGDRLGGRRVYLAGLAVFVAASVTCGLAPTLPVLAGARAVQGVGAALLVPASLTLLQASYDDPVVRARAIGVWAMVGGVGAAAGPLLGGLLIAGLGWRALFWVNLPVGVAGLVAVARLVRVAPAGASTRAGNGRRHFDLPGQLAAMICLLTVTAGIVAAGRVGPLAPGAFVPLGAGVLAGVAFVAIEVRRAEPMLPTSLLRDRAVGAPLLVGFVMNFSFYGQLFVLALALQRGRGYPPLAAGLALLPMTGFAALGSWLGGLVTSRAGPRPPMLAGMLAGAGGYAAMAFLAPHAPYPALVAPLVAISFGISFAMPAATAAVVESAGAGRVGVASGALNASRQLGGALGIAVLGAFVAGRGQSSAGLTVSLLVAAAAYLAGALAALLTPRPSHLPERAGREPVDAR